MSSSYNFQRVRNDRQDLSQVNAETLNVSGNASIGGILSVNSTVVQSVSGSVAVNATVDANSDITVVQPAGTFIKNLIVSTDAAITTANNADDDLNISIGGGASFDDLLVDTALLDGADATLPDNLPLYVISNANGHPANDFQNAGGPTLKSAKIELAQTTYSAAERNVNVRFTPVQADLVDTGTVTVVVEFQNL